MPRPGPLRRSKWRKLLVLTRLLSLVAGWAVFSSYRAASLLVEAPGGSCAGQEVVVSLTTTGRRLQTLFPLAARSLLRQAAPCPFQVWAFIPESDMAAARALAPALHAEARRHGRRLLLHAVPDLGPASKYLFTAAVLGRPAGDGLPVQWSSRPASTLVLGSGALPALSSRAELDRELTRLRQAGALALVLDDDSYHPAGLLAGLLAGRAAVAAAAGIPTRSVLAGARGWRVKEDLTWGVAPSDYRHHVIDGWTIAEPYRVGVATGLGGYLFDPGALGPGVDLSDYSGAPPGARLVDDIWINGHLARAGVQRWVVPLPDAAAALPADTSSSLDHAMREAGVTRYDANTRTLRFFSDAWEQGLWYLPGGQGGPRYKLWPPRAAAQAWTSLKERAMRWGWV